MGTRKNLSHIIFTYIYRAAISPSLIYQTQYVLPFKLPLHVHFLKLFKLWLVHSHQLISKKAGERWLHISNDNTPCMNNFSHIKTF